MYWIYLTVRYGTHRTISGLHQEQLIHVNKTTHMHPQHDNTIHTYLARSLLEGNGDSTTSECDKEDDDYNEDEAINISHREEVSLGETTQRVIMRGKRRGTCRLQISIIKI